MKRDFDLIRRILFEVEKSQDVSLSIGVDIEGYDQGAITYHVMLLDEAGLIVAIDVGDDRLEPVRLTWAGHEFLDAARNDTIWNKAMEIARRLGGLSFNLLLPTLLEYGKQAIGIP